MITQQLADKLTTIACRQCDAGVKMKQGRMDTIREIEDEYYNKVIDLGDGRINVPFPIMSSFVDTMVAKTDNPPSLTFKIPNRQLVSDKVAAAWKMDTSSMRAAWARKDREEKKFAWLSGRGIASIFASSVGGKYKSHYNVIDHFSFVCQGTRGHLSEMLYKGQMGIWKTKAKLEAMAKNHVYNPGQVQKLVSNQGGSGETKTEDEQREKLDRMRSLGLTPDQNEFVGQPVNNLTEWVMDYDGEEYYLLFDPKAKIWVRADKLKEVFACNKEPYVSWATNGGNASMFWDKGKADDVLPVGVAIKMILCETLENNRRRNRPMRIVKGGDFPDVTELMDYMPDNIIVTNSGKKGEIVTVQTPEITTSVNLVQFLNSFLGEKTGSAGSGVDEKDTKVAVFYGQLQIEADLIGTPNKAYSEANAEKGYRYFWGMKEHLTEPKSIEMLGKNGAAWQELSKTDFEDVDDVDDIIVSGGSREEQANAMAQKQQSESLASLTANKFTAPLLNPRKVIKSTLKIAGFEDEDVQEFLDTESDPNTELMNEADEAITQIQLGKKPRLNRGANIAFLQRLLDWTIDDCDYILLDKNGKATGVDEKLKATCDRVTAYMNAHQEIVIQNQQRDLRKKAAEIAATQAPQPASPGAAVRPPVPTPQERQAAAARPFESPAAGTPEGTQSRSQDISNTLSP